jgi:preprotein translocase subunit SecF
VGVVVGTYSSIFVASTTALALGVTQENLMPVEVEGREFDLDQMP